MWIYVSIPPKNHTIVLKKMIPRSISPFLNVKEGCHEGERSKVALGDWDSRYGSYGTGQLTQFRIQARLGSGGSEARSPDPEGRSHATAPCFFQNLMCLRWMFYFASNLVTIFNLGSCSTLFSIQVSTRLWGAGEQYF